MLGVVRFLRGMSLVSRQYIRDLIELAAFECVDFFGKGKEGHANLPHVELRIERLVEVENKQARSESRPNAIGTNGATSILVDIEQVPYPIDTIRSRWSEIMSLPKVSKLLASFADYRLRSSIVTNPVPSGAPRDIDNYCIVTLSDAIVRIERGKEVDNWSLASAGRLLQTLSSDKQVSTIVAPLVNFYVQSKQPISFTDNVTIRPATQDEIEEFGVRKSILGHELTSLHGFVRFLPVLWVAETSFTRTPNSGAPDLQSFEEVDAIVAALNILGDEFFDYPLAAFTDQPYNHSSRGQPNPRTPAFHNWSPFEGPFVLQAPDISRVCSSGRCPCAPSSAGERRPAHQRGSGRSTRAP